MFLFNRSKQYTFNCKIKCIKVILSLLILCFSNRGFSGVQVCAVAPFSPTSFNQLYFALSSDHRRIFEDSNAIIPRDIVRPNSSTYRYGLDVSSRITDDGCPTRISYKRVSTGKNDVKLSLVDKYGETIHYSRIMSSNQDFCVYEFDNSALKNQGTSIACIKSTATFKEISEEERKALLFK